MKSRAFVKSVISGDTLVLRPKTASANDLIFTLTNISAPRFAARSADEEENYAFNSREFLRSFLVGKEVQLNVEHSISSDRHFGTLEIQHAVDGETDVARILVKNGTVSVKTNDSKKTLSEEQQVLAELEGEAKAKKLGIWSDKPYKPRTVRQTFEGDSRKFLQDNKAKPINAIIEQVRDGSSFRVLLLLTETIHQFINLNLSGVKCPKLEDPFGVDAKTFVETRLLQRSVKVHLESVSGTAFYGTIEHPAGNIAEVILREGLGQIIDWNINSVKNPEKYKFCQAHAQSQQIRLWKGFVKQAETTISGEFFAVVKRILGPDMLVIESASKPGIERKVGLSSIRGPKRQKNEAGLEVGYYNEAVEFLRFRLVGNKIKVKTDYVTPADGEYEAKENVTILKNNKNVGEALVRKGLAGVIKHKRDDNNRSPFYEALLQAENQAKEEGLGIHSTEPLPIHRVVDASANLAKAKSCLSQLQKSNTVKGIVEYVASGSRYRVYIPSLKYKLLLVLSGIKTPKASGSSGQKEEPFGDEALKFAQSLSFQRDVEISIEQVDKVGGFIGSLFVPVAGKLENMSILLLSKGLSTIHEFSASQSVYKNQLYEAEGVARENRLNLWKDYDANVKNDTEEVEKVEIESASKIMELTVSEIRPNGQIYVQVGGEALDKLEAMMGEFKEYHTGAGQKVASPLMAQAGSYCSAQFSSDNQWYRARVEKVSGVNQYQVFFIDYGNTEVVPGSRLRALPPQFSVSKLPAQATAVSLAYVEFPAEDSEFLVDAVEELGSMVLNRKLAANFIGKDKSGRSMVMLYVQTDGPSFDRIVSVNENLIKSGLSLVPQAYVKKFNDDQRQLLKTTAGKLQALKNANSNKKSDLELLINAMEAAKKSHLNLWQYGDFTHDDYE